MEFSSRKSRLAQKAQENQLAVKPEDILKNKATPDFLKNARDVEEQIRIETLAKAKQEKIVQDAVIEKAAQVSKQVIAMNENVSSQKYKNFVNYMELRRIAGDESVEVDDTQHTQRTSRQINENDDEEEEEEDQNEDVNTTAGLGFKGEVPKVNRQGQIAKMAKKPGKFQNKRQVKDREKIKRAKGQSSQTSWKSEEFMKLRQNYD